MVNIRCKRKTFIKVMIIIMILAGINGHLKSKAMPNSDNLYKKNDEGIPVLMYHCINDESFNTMVVSKNKFNDQMKYLKDNNYKTLTMDELYNFIEKNISVPKKSVVITFDDGYVDNYLEAYPILKQYGLRATIFVITDYIDKEKAYLTSSQLKEMEKNKVMDIQSHTAYHDKLNKLNYDKQLKTLKLSKKTLEDILNKEVKYIAYPYGMYNEDTLKAVKDSEYMMAFSAYGKWANKDNGTYTLDRIYMGNMYNIRQFKSRLNNPRFKIFD